MTKQRTYLIFGLLFLFSVVLTACRREDAEPTPVPEANETVAVPPTEIPSGVQDSQAGGENGTETELVYDWAPTVVYSAPIIGEELLLDGVITVRFDQPMDEETVGKALSVRQAGKNDSVDGDLTWTDTDTFIFTPKEPLQRQTLYELGIAETAQSRSGNALLEPVNLMMLTVGYLEVSQVIPEANTNNVETDAAITVMFNRPVVPLVSSGQQANLPQPLEFEPAVLGQGEWVSTSIYRFTPEDSFAGATRYRAIVPADLEDVTGGTLAQDFVWNFTSENPNVVRTSPENEDIGVNPSEALTVTFNMPMDKGSTESAFMLQPEAPVKFIWSENDTILAAIPAPNLELETAYELSVATSARAANGQAGLDRATTVFFDTVPFPAILETIPASGAIADRYQQGFTIAFASPMDVETIKDGTIIEPAPDDPTYYLNEFNNSLYVGFELERNTEYQVTVPGSAADPFGNTLGEDYSWSFTTPGFEPLVSLNLPEPISQLSTSQPTSVDIIHRNVTRIDGALYNADLPIEALVESRIHDYVPSGEAQRMWSVPVELSQDTADILSLDLADGDTLSPGVYFLEVGGPEIVDDQSYWQNHRNMLVIADTNLVVKEMFGQVYIWATRLIDGTPAAGLDVTLFDVNGNQAGKAITDGGGLANFAYRPPEDHLPGVLVVSSSPGEDGFGIGSSNWSNGISPWRFGLDSAWRDEPAQYVYLHTDRPIYRPGDTVQYRGIVRDTDYGRYPFPTVDEVTVNLDFLTDFEPVEYAFVAELDGNGEFSGEYTIPEDAQLGTYRLYFQGSEIEADRTFTVAEYRKPEFQVTVTPSGEETLRGEPVDVAIEAEYFFGGSAADLLVNWNVSEMEYRLPWDGPYYSFADDGDFFFEPGDPLDFGPGGVFGQYVTGGEGRTDAEGRLVIELPADLLAEVGPGSREVVIEASVFDITDFPVSARASTVFHDGEIYAGITPAENVGLAGTEMAVDLITIDWQGRAQPGREVEVAFYERNWQPLDNGPTPGGFTQWEAMDELIEITQVTTDQIGKAEATFTPAAGGTYLAVATVVDSGGRAQTSTTVMWVSDSSYVGWRTDPNEKRMDLVPDQQEYRPGDVARVLVQSPFEGPVNAWLTLERGDLIEQRIVTLQTNSDILEIPVTPDLAPNVYLSLHVVKGVDESNPFADVRIGIVELVVSPEQFELDILVTPQRDLYQPGETAVYDILVTDYQGNPVQTSLALSLVDLAVLSLKQDNAPQIMDGFYYRQPIRSQTGSGLIISGEGLEIEIPVEQLGLGGGGGGLEAAEAERALDSEGEDVRSDFRDTAFWLPNIETDEAGKATVEIPLPDNVTTWRLSSKGVSDYASSNETLVGQSDLDVMSTLPLLLRPVTPRFFTVGDLVQIGAVVQNNTNSALNISVNLEAAGVSLLEPAQQNVSVPAGSGRLVRWLVSVDDVEFADLTFIAEGGEFRDSTKPTFGIAPDQLIPIVRYAGEDVVGTSGVLAEAGRRVEAILLPQDVDTRQGELLIQLSPSLAAAMTEALDFANNHEIWPSCAHAISYRLLTNAATMLAVQRLDLADPDLTQEMNRIIDSDISRLEELQKRDGGWSWCYSEASDPYLSAYGLFALSKAEKAGFQVNESVLNKGVTYLGNQLETMDDLTNRSEVNRQAFFLYVLSEVGHDIESELDDLVDKHRGLMDPYAKALLAVAYEPSGGSSNQQTLLADINSSAIVSASGAHWENEEPDWDNLASDIRNTAMIIQALAQLDPEGPLGPNAVRWLMVARTAGHWPSLQENAWSVLSLTEWMVATSELEADFSFDVGVNGQPLASGQFDQTNVTSNENLSVAVDELVTDEVNFIDFQRLDGPGRLYYTAYLDSFIRAENLEPIDRGFFVQRTYFDAACDPDEEDCQPISEIGAGEQVRVELTIIVPNDQVFAVVEDPIPAGAEAIDPGLETSVSGSGGSIQRIGQEYECCFWGWWYFDRIEYRDEKVVFLSEFLPAGTYQYTYTLQTAIPGEYQVNPATARLEFFPEVFGRSDGFLFEITE